MVILELYQGDYKKDLVAFDSLEEGRAFVAQIPGYSLEIEDGFEVEFFNPTNLPDYMEIIYNGNIVPLSKWMFNSEANVDIVWNATDMKSTEAFLEVKTVRRFSTENAEPKIGTSCVTWTRCL